MIELPTHLKEQLASFLREHKDVFARKPTNMPGFSTSMIVHNCLFRKEQKGGNFEAHMGDMLIKSMKEVDYLADLRETLNIVR